MRSWKIRPKALPTVATLFYIFLWAPAITLIVLSFSQNKYGIKWEGFTLKWYAYVYNNIAIRDALMKSLFIASVAVVVATIAGTLTAYGLYKHKFRGRKLLRTSILLPITIPYVVTAGALLAFFTHVLPIPLGYPAIIIAHISFSVPLAVFVVLGRMARIDWTLEEASADLGADGLTTWRKITLPLLLPAILASAALIFPWSFNDFTITYFVAGIGTTTLPIYVFSQLRYGTSGPFINTIGTFFILLPVIAILLMNFLQKKEVV